MSALPRHFGERATRAVAASGAPDARGWITLNLSFESLFTARERILTCGDGVEVVSPQALRLSELDFATQTIDLYKRR